MGSCLEKQDGPAAPTWTSLICVRSPDSRVTGSSWILQSSSRLCLARRLCSKADSVLICSRRSFASSLTGGDAESHWEAVHDGSGSVTAVVQLRLVPVESLDALGFLLHLGLGSLHLLLLLPQLLLLLLQFLLGLVHRQQQLLLLLMKHSQQGSRIQVKVRPAAEATEEFFPVSFFQPFSAHWLFSPLFQGFPLSSGTFSSPAPADFGCTPAACSGGRSDCGTQTWNCRVSEETHSLSLSLVIRPFLSTVSSPAPSAASDVPARTL